MKLFDSIDSLWMANGISGHHHSRYELFDFNGFHHRASLQKVDLTIAFEEFPEDTKVHLLKDALVASLHSQFASLLDLKGIVGARVTDIMHKRGNEHIKPLLLGEHSLKTP
jgi:hypothetical protein